MTYFVTRSHHTTCTIYYMIHVILCISCTIGFLSYLTCCLIYICYDSCYIKYTLIRVYFECYIIHDSSYIIHTLYFIFILYSTNIPIHILIWLLHNCTSLDLYFLFGFWPLRLSHPRIASWDSSSREGGPTPRGLTFPGVGWATVSNLL